MSGKPSYLRAAVEDWKAKRISSDRLCEIWGVPLFATFHAFHRSQWSNEWRDIPTEQIEEIMEGLK